MELTEAIELISNSDITQKGPQTWADLGCGAGMFTQALASLLPAKSRVYAMDRSRQLADKDLRDVSIVFRQADFEKEDLKLPILDGILMANSLHYIADAHALTGRLIRSLQPAGGQFIIVEYDSDIANQWVPYPLPFSRLRELFSSQGFNRIEKIGEKKSLYRKGNLYACHIQR